MGMKGTPWGVPPRRLRGEGRYCRECHYPLAGLGSPGKCPECGCDFDFSLLYSYAVDPRPPTLLERLFSRRMVALYFAIALEVLVIWLLQSHGKPPRGSMVWYGLFGATFSSVWLLMFASGLDERCEEVWQFMLASGVIGLLLFVPLAWIIGWETLVAGFCWGLITGGVLPRLQGRGLD